ncbi:MAG: GNAT family N-acetyltransferase [Bacteroidota bacterium]|nr:GNAT family N-acetyltransferase [Bacteroidota bacterium]
MIPTENRYRFVRTDSFNEDFRSLVALLDRDLSERDGTDHSFYAQFNGIATIKHAIVAYDQDTPIGSGAIKEWQTGSVEVKRMFVLPEYRGRGIALQLLKELEQWALVLGYGTCVLETGKRQPEAIALYEKAGYRRIPNYGQYEGVENSCCFEKKLPVE